MIQRILASVLLLALLVFWLPKVPFSIIEKTAEGFAAVFFVDSSTPEKLNNSHNQALSGVKKLKVIIVPGHDDEVWGAQYKGLKEAEMNLKVAKLLQENLSMHSHIEAVLVRNDQGYNGKFLDFKEVNRERIMEEVVRQKNLMQALLEGGMIEKNDGAFHNAAASEVAETLYSVNAWADEIGADLVLHIHFNDYPRRGMSMPGKYSGIAVYVPDQQYSNAKGSRALGESIYKRLSNWYPTSDYPKESSGVVEDQELIAIGAFNTLNPASVLLEYGYIYEPQFRTSELRDVVFKDLAFQTYLGIADFFKFQPKNASTAKISLAPVAFGDKESVPVFLLQKRLREKGWYPPQGETLSDCPISGTYGSCTRRAIRAFAESSGISVEDAIPLLQGE